MMWNRLFHIKRSLPFILPLSFGFNVIADDNGYKQLLSHWKHWIYPLRPHKSEVDVFLNILEMLPLHKDVLILGSTPELRDIAFMTEKNVTCVDMDAETMQIMKNNMKYGKYLNDESEIMIECDWLKMDQHSLLSQQQFDLILAEESINMLQFEDWEIFLDQMLDRLKDTGFFVIKTMIKPPKGYFAEIEDVDQMVKMWEKSEYKYDLGYLFVHLLAFMNERKGDNECINLKEVMQCIENIKINEQKQSFLNKFSGLNESDFIFYCLTEERIREMMIERGFYFENVHYGNHDADKYKFTPIYVLGKQSWLIGGKARALTTADQEMQTQNRLDHIG